MLGRMSATTTPPSEVVFPGRRWAVTIPGPEPLPDQIDLFAALLKVEAHELAVAAALAEACGLAWCERERGGWVELSGTVAEHHWWPVLRAWLPEDTPVRIVENASGEALPEAPWPPVFLPQLPRDGQPPFPTTDLTAAFDWLDQHAPQVLLIEAAADETHPALVIAHAAIAGCGIRVCWRIIGRPDWHSLMPALVHIGGRQQPLQMIVDELPPTPIPGWWIATPIDAGATAAALTHHLQHEWPGIVVASARAHAEAPGPWQPGRLSVVREGSDLCVCLPDEVERVAGALACPTTVQPAPRERGVRFVGPAAWAAALGYP